MLQLSTTLPAKSARTLVDRVRERIANLRCEHVWARSAGSHILLGLSDEEAFARLSPLGGACFGLAFRTGPAVGLATGETWEPLLLVDSLADVVEHALIAVDVLR